MGVYTGSFAGIGIIFSSEDFEGTIQRTVVPSCNHAEREGNTFCPKCGVRVENRVEKTSQYDFGEAIEYLEEDGGAGDLTFACIDSYSGKYFLGWGRWANDDTSITTVSLRDFPDPNDIWPKIADTLQRWPFLIDDKRFNFHIVKTWS
jgi:hypothetical protein